MSNLGVVASCFGTKIFQMCIFEISSYRHSSIINHVSSICQLANKKQHRSYGSMCCFCFDRFVLSKTKYNTAVKYLSISFLKPSATVTFGHQKRHKRVLASGMGCYLKRTIGKRPAGWQKKTAKRDKRVRGLRTQKKSFGLKI